MLSAAKDHEKRFEETIAGLQADVSTKKNARQALQTELDESIAARRQRVTAVDFTSPISANQANQGLLGDLATPNEYAGSEDALLDSETGPLMPAADDEEDEEDGDDLFGDDDVDEEDMTAAISDTASPTKESGDRDPEHGTYLEQEDVMIDADMAAMLNAEMASISDSTGRLDVENSTPGAENVTEYDIAMPAMDVHDIGYANSITSHADTQIQGGFGVEGGVGMRRLATGVLDDDEDGDSDSSASSG